MKRISQALRRRRRNSAPSSVLRLNSLSSVHWRFLSKSSALDCLTETHKSKHNFKSNLTCEKATKYNENTELLARLEEYVSIPPLDGDYINQTYHHDADDDDDDGDEKNNDSCHSDESRSSSPVIVWQPSTRVKLATNLPVELKSVFEKEGDNRINKCENKMKREINKSIRLSKSSIQRNIMSTKHHDHHSHHRKKPAKIQYGAWYLPPHTWSLAKLKRQQQQQKHQHNQCNDVHEDSVINSASTKHIENVLPSLFISKAYKSFIAEQDNNSIPHYLISTNELKGK